MGRVDKRLEIGPVAFLVAALMFMEFLDGSIIPTAAPAIAHSFHILSSQVGISVTVYMVTIVVCIPLSAWLADKFGVRLILFISIAVFTAASLFCALSTNLVELTTMRVLQGLGAASMVPVGRLILMRSVDRSEVIRVISYSVWPALAAPVVAPVLGGFLVSHASWHWIFLVNIPIGLIAFIVGVRIVPHINQEETKNLDWFGLAGVGVSLGMLVFAAANLGAPHINIALPIFLSLVGVLVGIPTLRHLKRDPEALIDLSVLQIQTFKLNSVSGLLFRLAQNTAPFVLPLLFQERFGWSAERAGGVLFFYMAGNLGFKAFTTPLMERFRFKPLILVSTLLSIPLTLTLGLLTPSIPFIAIAILLLITGGVRSIGMTLYNTITFADTDQERISHANTIANMVQQLSSAAAVATAVIAIGIGRSLAGTRDQYLWSFSLAILALLLSLPSVLSLPPLAGQALRKKAYS